MTTIAQSSAPPICDHATGVANAQVGHTRHTQTREDRRITGETSTPIVKPRVEYPIEALKEIHTLTAQIKHLEEDLADSKKREIVPLEAPVRVAMPVLALEAMFEIERGMEAIITQFFKPGIHYGEIPGTNKKKVLFKIGAEWMLKYLGLYPDYQPVEVIRDFDRPLIFYEYRCELRKTSTGQIVAVAIGSCSSEEDRYKYRMEERTCPTCGKATIIKGKEQYGGGWVCWKKNGGCGAKYPKGAVEIENQQVGKVVNPDLTGLAHTISAMAQKRAFVLAIRTNTGISAYFEDVNLGGDDPGYDDDPMVIEDHGAGASLTPIMIKGLIDFAISLLPEGHTFTRADIGSACLKALNMESWSQAIIGTEDELKAKIQEAIETKFPKSRTPIKNEDEQPEAAEDETDCASPGCRKPAQGGDSPYPQYCAECAGKLADKAAAATKKGKK